MTFQTEVNEIGVVGVGVESRLVDGFRDVSTETSSAVIAFGDAVSRANDGTVSATVANTVTNLYGVALSKSGVVGSSDDTYPVGDVLVMRRGYVNVAVTGPVTPGTAVHVSSAGKFSGTGGATIANASFEGTVTTQNITDGENIVTLRING